MIKDNSICRGHVFYFEPNDTSIGKDQYNNDVPLMPNFEDMCISMSLTAEIFQRNDKNCLYSIEEQGNATKIQKTISWISYSGQNTLDTMKLAQNVVNDGENFGGEKYLTTYYTEISADKYVENELVEGLGVTNVDVSFESWYTPTITIKFIDIHGSSLWGREEAIHENGRITSDNILGVFFTQPYPLFRLQIKGFLGQSVTYQLTVSGFNGRYNSQTGNFEITAKFIGYSYSLLTDIPLSLLSCVSEMSYVGKQYWDAHVNTPQWALKRTDGTYVPPTPLYILIENIRSAVGSFQSIEDLSCDDTPLATKSVNPNGSVKSAVEKDQTVNLADAKTVSDATKSNTELDSVNTTLKAFLDECEKFCSKGFFIYGKTEESENGDEQILLVPGVASDSTTKDIATGDSFRTAYVAFNEAVEKFNKANPNATIKNEISDKNPYDFHKTITKAKKGEFKLKCDKIFYVSKDASDKKDYAIVFKENLTKSKEKKELKVEGLKICGLELYKSTAAALQEKMDKFNDKSKNADFKNCNGFGSFGFILPLGKLRSDLQHRFDEINKSSNNARVAAENKEAGQSNSSTRLTAEQKRAEAERKRKLKEEIVTRKILEVIGFEPTVGNFVKLLMCHLETFTEVMFRCAEKIVSEQNDGKRLPQQMGLSDGLNSTDIPDSNATARGTGTQDEYTKPIFAWPTLYRPKNTTNSETKTDKQFDVLGIPIDYTPENGYSWEETKVLTSFMDAIARCTEHIESQTNKQTLKYINSIPMSALDLYIFDSPFRFVSKDCNNIENLSAYLGIRMAQVIGVSDNKCSSEIAEAIGSVDALNLITSYSKPEELYNAITPKDGKLNFSERVIDYITCNNKTMNSSEIDDGTSFNVFETQVGKNYYNKTRHSIFYKDGDNFKYSYVYTLPNKSQEGEQKEMISIVPTDLLSFKGLKNPYSEIFDVASVIVKNETSGKNEVINFYLPHIDDKGVQHWVHTSKSSKINSLTSNDKYENSFMFNVISNGIGGNTIESQINTLKEGQLKIKGYTVQGIKEDEKLKAFIERRYKFDANDYKKFYFGSKNYGVFGPTSEYTLKEEEPKKEEGKDETEKGKESTQVTKKGKKTIDEAFKLGVKVATENFNKGENVLKMSEENEFSFKYGDKTLTEDEVYVHDLPMKRNGKIVSSIFGNEIYYAQNDIEDVKLRDLSKLYLILSSMMAGIEEPEKDFFKSDETSIIKKFPRFYVLFIGALLWRRSLENGIDLNHGSFKENFPDKNTSLISKSDKILSLDTSKKCDWYTIADYYMPYDEIDIIVKNKLIKLFTDYANSAEFLMVYRQGELLDKEGAIIGSQKWNDFKGQWSKSDFDSKNVEHWQQIFGFFSDRITSIILSEDSQSFSLLFNESYSRLGHIEYLYGLGDFMVLSRSTTKRIGKGENEVKLLKSQMTGYLKGFEERIKDFKQQYDEKEDDNEEVAETEYDRDILVSMYYSLQHVWSTWLITSSRDQFTIENFFNKYFIFMDSFYTNVYNDIKLNVQTISDAYKTKDISLLTFIQHVTSDAGMMLFALPDFVDSNVYKDSTVKKYASKSGGGNFEWGRENLGKLFKPIPFIEQNPQKVNNMFVFIYTHKFSDNALENTDKKFNSYMLNDYGMWPEALTKPVVGDVGTDGSRMYDANDETMIVKPNNNITNPDEELVSGRHGYWMPCFGVTVNRGNNYIFKSINVNMDSPKVTSASAQTWENILTKTGSDASKRINFHGQDIYSIYSQYAYSCEIEMLGCAQIQPLMYFQLLNIPMWCGTYMVYKVQHSMSPGTMTTKFTGMKMSKYQTPFATGYFTLPKESTSKPTKAVAKGTTKTNPAETKPENDASQIQSSGGQWYVGGEKMIKAIFGDYTGYRYSKNGNDYDEYRGKAAKSGRDHWHCGIDISGAEGTPLHAPWDGYIKFAYLNAGSAGNYFMLADNNNQNAVVYMHNKELKVKTGDKVKAGQIVSLLGRTGGNACYKTLGTSSHLHLELYVNGKLTMGESTRHGGKGGHVNPTTEFGTIGSVSVPTSEKSEKTKSSNSSLVKTHSGKKSCVIVGDSWGDGLKDYFQYSVSKCGEQLKKIYNEFIPAAIQTDATKVIISCGLYDASSGESTLKEWYVKMGKKVVGAGKECYICTFPPLKYPSGYHGCINEDNINKLNKAINGGSKSGKYKVIEIGDITSGGKSNISSDGFHLNSTGWKKMYDKIHSSL